MWVVGIKSGIGEEEDSRMSRTPDVFVETRKLLPGTRLCRPLVRPRAPGRSTLDKAAPFQLHFSRHHRILPVLCSLQPASPTLDGVGESCFGKRPL